MTERAEIAHAEFFNEAAELLADVIWWHHGFAAAFAANDGPHTRQPDMHRLVDLRVNMLRMADGGAPNTKRSAFP